jgi:hypothetical protein
MLKQVVRRVIAIFGGAIDHITEFSLRMPVYDPSVVHVGYVVY